MIDYPAKKLGSDNINDYIDVVFALANKNLPLKEIAALCRCSPSTLKQSEPIMTAIRFGWAEHRLAIESELLGLALARPEEITDVSERIAVRNNKTKALVTIKQFLEKKDEFMESFEAPAASKLSDEELDKQLKKFISTAKLS